jgi:hypothetical protein
VGSSCGRWLREPELWRYYEDGKKVEQNGVVRHFGHCARWIKLKTGLLSVVAIFGGRWCLRHQSNGCRSLLSPLRPVDLDVLYRSALSITRRGVNSLIWSSHSPYIHHLLTHLSYIHLFLQDSSTTLFPRDSFIRLWVPFRSAPLPRAASFHSLFLFTVLPQVNT